MAGAVAINFQNLSGFRIAQLIPVTATDQAAITWARANGLLANQMQCSSLQCMAQNRPMHEVPDGKQVDGKQLINISTGRSNMASRIV